ncbi:putative quinol monooxygenase [Mycetocola sp. 2940]|uniref:putative quinol monooxygenase n=1 Tax=Mycetocola sp. 2940 TaxID=3156452 RepID=UPI003396AD44
MTDPVIVIATATPLPGRAAEIVDALGRLIPRVHAEPGCLLYTLNQAESGQLVFIEKWASQADADRHASSSAIMPELIEQVLPLLVGPPVVVAHSALPMGEAVKGTL